MHAMLNRCIDTGLKLNPDKCFVKQEKIKFYGVICGQDGVQPDPGKVSALKQMSSPTNRQELQTFLGLANYTGPFIPNLITLTAPLRELLKEDNRKPVAFASKAVTDVESRYANIERELLAVVYGYEKFHTYLYGRSFTIHTDHKPLESIPLKHLTAAPPRLQRMLLRL